MEAIPTWAFCVQPFCADTRQVPALASKKGEPMFSLKCPELGFPCLFGSLGLAPLASNC